MIQHLAKKLHVNANEAGTLIHFSEGVEELQKHYNEENSSREIENIILPQNPSMITVKMWPEFTALPRHFAKLRCTGYKVLPDKAGVMGK